MAAFGVEVGVEIALGKLRRHSILRHLCLGHPKDGVEHCLAEVIVAPIQVVVATREPKAATTVFTPVCPGNVLGFTSGNRLANSRVAAMGSITALQGFLWLSLIHI